MSMIITLRCDVRTPVATVGSSLLVSNCDKDITTFTVEDAAQVRREAAAQGWAHVDGKDYCHRHARLVRS